MTALLDLEEGLARMPTELYHVVELCGLQSTMFAQQRCFSGSGRVRPPTATIAASNGLLVS
jgi:hypothetical protein